MSARILIVDDEPLNIELLVELLKDNYRTLVAKNGQQALQRAQSLPDLILLDVMMPDMDGYTVCATLKSDPKTTAIPIIFVTAMSDVEAETRGLALGAVDYITKPISPPIVQARIHNHLQLQAARLALEQHNQQLEQLVNERTREVELTQDVTILCMASLAETRDTDTGNHIRRTQHYVRILAQALRSHPRFQTELTEHNINLLFKSAPLHDIGKVGVPDNVLLKPAKLTDDEFGVMKHHTTAGRDAIARAEAWLANASPKAAEHSFLRYAREIAYSHQEKWDGSGYPEGLAGEAIPLSARLMAVADVYDALISKRVYKPAMPHTEAVAIIAKGSGSHFDPDVVSAFLHCEAAFADIAQQFGDSED